MSYFLSPYPAVAKVSGAVNELSVPKTKRVIWQQPPGMAEQVRNAVNKAD